jgi:outer membrane PBP1 activator LpoA protein
MFASIPRANPAAFRATLAGTALLGMLLLGACGTPPPAREAPPPDGRPDLTATIEPRNEVEVLLAQADAETEPDARARYLVRAATLLRDQGLPGEARDLLEDLDLEELTAPRRAAVLLLQAELLPRDGDAADRTLALLRPDNFPVADVDAAAMTRYHAQRAAALSTLGRAPEAINEHIQLDRLMTPVEKNANHDALWRELKQLPDAQLRSLSSTAVDFDARGWYELSLAMRGADLDRQASVLANWRLAWGSHPASTALPTELTLSLEARPPARIALLLPLGSGAGQVIRDAFLGAYYNQGENGGSVPALRVYDADANTDILALHAQARQDGAELIIGPLLKQHVAALMAAPDLGVPTLALNTVDGMTPASPLLYQFALSPEDEARQLAQRAWRDGHRFAAVFSPRDTAGNDFYTRKRSAFTAEWERLGGTVVISSNYTDDYTSALTRLLALDASGERRRRVQELIGRPVEFTQRRRQDLDFLYLVSQPEPARLIVPSLAYLFAGDIPVYASQDVYSGGGRAVDDADLNGVLFPESPWLLAGEGGGIEQIKQLFPVDSAQNLRLQAFGIDAFRLASRLQLLAASSDFSIPGTSGLLHMNPQRNIERQLSWATITQGEVRPAPR